MFPVRRCNPDSEGGIFIVEAIFGHEFMCIFQNRLVQRLIPKYKEIGRIAVKYLERINSLFEQCCNRFLVRHFSRRIGLRHI